MVLRWTFSSEVWDEGTIFYTLQALVIKPPFMVVSSKHLIFDLAPVMRFKKVRVLKHLLDWAAFSFIFMFVP